MAAQAKVEAEFSNKAAMLAKQIPSDQAELLQAFNTFRTRLQLEDRRLSEIAAERAQLEADLAFLGLSKPHKSAAAAVALRLVRSPPAPRAGTSQGTALSGSVTCPTCGSWMVRRTAKRGYRRGNQFWGCSRYPACRGTRP